MFKEQQLKLPLISIHSTHVYTHALKHTDTHRDLNVQKAFDSCSLNMMGFWKTLLTQHPLQLGVSWGYGKRHTAHLIWH